MGVGVSRIFFGDGFGTNDSLLGVQGDGCRPGDVKTVGSDKDNEFNMLTIGEIQCIFVEVEPGKFKKKCERIEKTIVLLGGRPLKVLETAKQLSEEDVTDENAAREPYGNKFIRGSKRLQDWDVVACEVDADPFKLPKVPSNPAVALRKALDELNHAAERKQLSENKGKELTNNGKVRKDLTS